ncbi:MAG: TraX protein [Aerococcus sp.]|nr:TraX protein [Aerococcus sp.]
MTKKRRNALMMFVLTLLYAALQFFRPNMTLTLLNVIISFLIPIIAMLFALNLKEPLWRWPLIAMEGIVLILMVVFALTHSIALI